MVEKNGACIPDDLKVAGDMVRRILQYAIFNFCLIFNSLTTHVFNRTAFIAKVGQMDMKMRATLLTAVLFHYELFGRNISFIEGTDNCLAALVVVAVRIFAVTLDNI